MGIRVFTQGSWVRIQHLHTWGQIKKIKKLLGFSFSSLQWITILRIGSAYVGRFSSGQVSNFCQGWEFAHRFVEGIAGFFAKKWANEQFAQKNKWFSRELLTVAPFWWVTWAICSQLLFCHERLERFAHIAHQKRGNELSPRLKKNSKKRTKNTIVFLKEFK